MKIAVCGSGLANDPIITQKAKELGKEIARYEHLLLTGGCRGYPYAAERGCLLSNGKVIIYSPAKSEAEHKLKYNFPTDPAAEYIFTGLGIPERNLPLVKNADLVIILDGQIGTLNEFTIAFNEKKKIAVLKEGKLQELIPKIAEICNKTNEKANISYFTEPKELIRGL